MDDSPEYIATYKELPHSHKIYFASDFHLGVPSIEKSLDREKKIIKWLDSVKKDASAIFLLGDIFDFWFEYKSTVPKGFVRFLGKVAELQDSGIDMYFMVGNHDMWMNDYFEKHVGICVLRRPVILEVNQTKMYLAHGDGLGHGDMVFKVLKKIFTNPFFRWMFRWLHPDVGVRLAQYWSGKSRLAKGEADDAFQGEDEQLLQYSRKIHSTYLCDYYVYGHRHLPLRLEVAPGATYVNLGEWVSQCNYLAYNGEKAQLHVFH